MRAFWAKGYEATSLADLMSATGLHKGSLYQAFGDKHALFVQALNRYLADMRRQEIEALADAATPLTGLRNVMHMMIDMTDDDCSCPKGCLAINSLVELAPHDPQIQQIMSDHTQHMRSSVEHAVAGAQAAGEIGTGRPPEVIAAMLMTFMAGLAVTIKGLIDKGQAHELLDAEIEALT